MVDMPDTPYSMIMAFQVGRACALVSIPLHILVIGSVIRFRKKDKKLNNSYFHMLANLCAIDLIRVIQLTILKTWLYSFEGWRTSNDTILPRFDAICQYFAYQANLFALTAIAFNRLLEMTWPWKAKMIWTSNVTVFVNLGTWLCGLLFAIPLFSTVHEMEHMSLYQGIFWSNRWYNQTEADAQASKVYMNSVSTGGVIVSGALLGIYCITFGMMFKHRSTNLNSQAKKKYKTKINVTIQALVLTSVVFLYNIGLILYTRECCPWFVAPNIVAMLWAAHYSGPMFALCMSSVLRKNVRFLLKRACVQSLKVGKCNNKNSNKVGNMIEVDKDKVQNSDRFQQ